MQQEQQRNEGPSIITEYNRDPIEIGINQESDSPYLRPITNRPGTPRHKGKAPDYGYGNEDREINILEVQDTHNNLNPKTHLTLKAEKYKQNKSDGRN
ncbi:7328_t:CDS:2 [Dentiscutata erythropus]|uniref:7328_t:CDS:1 n=1 Tax=Dentiscutata erythropus TaxID=1348616 RepID=A0A9N8ZQG4_9GLOM|nr:7328_t:CDS:2 [Dentiscutata erythropus]